MWYNEKLIISGKFIEHYQYERFIKIGDENIYRGLGRAGSAAEAEKSENRKKVMQRARSMLRRLINSNVDQYMDGERNPYASKFFTMTYKENIQDVKYSNGEFRKFVKRLNRYVGYNVKYVSVLEFQKRGAVHYHVVFFNLPYIKKARLAEIWGHGHVKINKIEKVDNVGAYVSKYMGKDLEDKRLLGEKCYFSSRGLKKPEEIKDRSRVRVIMESLTGSLLLKYEKSFNSDYTGEIYYTQYCTE